MDRFSLKPKTVAGSIFRLNTFEEYHVQQHGTISPYQETTRLQVSHVFKRKNATLKFSLSCRHVIRFCQIICVVFNLESGVNIKVTKLQKSENLFQTLVIDYQLPTTKKNGIFYSYFVQERTVLPLPFLIFNSVGVRYKSTTRQTRQSLCMYWII